MASAARVYETGGSCLSRRRYSCLGKAAAGPVDLARSDTCCAFVLPRGYGGRAVLVVDSKLNGVMEYRSFGLLCFLRITSRGRAIGALGWDECC